MQSLSKFILFKLWGWSIEGEYPKGVHKFVTIAAPHTHWLDFPLGILFRNAVGLDIKFLAKASLFKGPFGWFFKMTGGFPVERSKSTNKVDTIVNIFNENKEFMLALSPEGTRQKVTTWKTGFYHIAAGAGVPIILVTFDFQHKVLKISKPIYPSDFDKDMQTINEFYRGVIGKVPEYS